MQSVGETGCSSQNRTTELNTKYDVSEPKRRKHMKTGALVKRIFAASAMIIACAAAFPASVQTVSAEPAADLQEHSVILNESKPEESPVPTDYSALKAAIAEAEAMDMSQYEEDAVKSFVFVLNAAKRVAGNEKATQDMVDAAVKSLENAKKDLKGGQFLPQPVIYTIVGACLLIVAAAAFMLTRKKKEPKPVSADVSFEKPAYNEQPSVPVQPSGYQEAGGGSETSLLESAGETTLLVSGSAGETTLLAPTSFGTLVNTKTEEKIVVSKDHFRIGREKTSVDYCVENNTNVGRFHAEIISEGPHTYIVDKHSKNGTFLNDVRIEAEEPVEIIDGDKLTFADEEFTYLQ